MVKNLSKFLTIICEKPVKIGEGGGNTRKYLPTYFMDDL